MRRVGLCSTAVFLGVEIDNKVTGCIRATYDGARTIIHSRRDRYRRLTVLLGKASTLSCCLYF